MTPNKDTPAFPTITWEQLETGQIVQATEYSGLTKRELIASKLDVRSDIADYSLDYLEALVGRGRPSAPTTAGELLKWDAEVEAKIKVIKADALLTELSKP